MPMSKFQCLCQKSSSMSISEFQSQCQMSKFQKSQCQMSKFKKGEYQMSKFDLSGPSYRFLVIFLCVTNVGHSDW